MMDFAADIPLFLDAFGEAVTFMSSGNFFTAQGIFSVNTEPIILLDSGTGSRNSSEYTLTCEASDVADVSPLYTVDIRGIEYKVLAVTFNPVMATTEILLGRPS